VRALAIAVVLAVAAALLVPAPARAADGGSVLSGRLVTADGSPWDGSPWTVAAVPVDGGTEVSAPAAPDGAYRLEGVAQGRYRIRAVPAEEHSGVPAMWHGGTTSEQDATVVTVGAGQELDGLDVERLTAVDPPSVATADGRPYVVGTPRVGWTLTARTQSWTLENDWAAGLPVLPEDFRYQWFADGEPVAGATSARFAPSAAQLGRRLSVRIGIAIPNTTLASEDTSVEGTPVVRGRNQPCSRVRLSGKAKVGRTLTASRSRCWTAAGTRVKHLWYVDGHRVATTSSPRLRMRKAYRGDRVSVRVVATAPGYSTAVVRTPSRKVR
jgi:hypothetical protein